VTGWLIFLGIALLILLPLAWPARIGRSGLMLAVAAVFVAAAGYAWQGSPGLPGAPAAGQERPMRPLSIFAIERQRFLNHYGETGVVLGTADAFERSGEAEAAAGLLRNEIAKHPQDVDLRIGYANALLELAQGTFTPAVTLAFDRAEQVARPDNPAAAYFRGLAQIETGDAAGAEQRWRALYASLPDSSPWKAAIGKRLLPFDMIRAAQARRDGTGSEQR
jgi:cytochrome c-type biogenesis protein CcmH